MADDKTKVFSAMRARTQENIARQKAEEYTPTTDSIGEGYAFTVQSKIAGATFGQGLAEFDRWLATHDAAVRADMQREVRTVEELDALPHRSVILDSAGDVWQRRDYIWCGYEVARQPSWKLANHDDPATVLFTPSTPNQTGAEQ